MNSKDACALVIILAHIINGVFFVAYCPRFFIHGKSSDPVWLGCLISGEIFAVAFIAFICANCCHFFWRKFSRTEIQIKPDGDQENPLQEIVISPLTRIRRATHL